MTIAAAESFILRAVADPVLVQRINAAPDKNAVNEIISELSLNFDADQFQKAYFNLLTSCQTELQANGVKEVKLWWDCLEYSFQQTNQNE